MMSIDWPALAATIYGLLGIAWVTFISLDATRTRNWHLVLAYSVFLPTTLIWLVVSLGAVAALAVRDWLMEDA